MITAERAGGGTAIQRRGESAASRWALAGAQVAAALAALFLWTWGAGVDDLLGATSEHVAASPMASVLVLILSLSVLVRHRWPSVPAGVRFARASSGLVVFASAAGLLQSWQAGTSIRGGLVRDLNGTLVGSSGHAAMADETGAILIALAIVWWMRNASRPSLAASGYLKALAGGILAVLGFCLAQRLGFAPGLPAPGDHPMSLWTMIAVIPLALTLLHPTRRLEPREGDGTPEVRWAEERRIGMGMVAAVALALVVGVLGAAYLRWEQRRTRERVQHVLRAIGDLKAAQIVNWRQERLSDARFFAQAAFVRRDVEAYLAEPSFAAAETELRHWLNLLQGGDRYERVTFFDVAFQPRLGVPDLPAAPEGALREFLAHAVDSERVVIRDLHCDEATGEPRWEIAFRVSAAEAGLPPLGVVLLRLDPRQFLYPLVGSWPMPDRTGEMILVRVEGEQVAVLNRGCAGETTETGDAPPLVLGAGPGALADLLRAGGQAEGVDARGVRVLADLRPLAESPWYLIAKIDRPEVYGPLQLQARLTLMLTAGLAVAAGLAVRLVTKQREARMVRAELATERERRILAERNEHLMQSANDVILLANEAGQIVEANRQTREFYGYDPSELIGARRDLLDVAEPGTEAPGDARRVRDADGERAVYETVHRRKDGSTFPVEISRRTVAIDGKRHRLDIVRNISGRRASEREIARLNRLYATLSRINQSVLRLSSRHDLLDEACRITAEQGGFALAWIGWPDRTAARIRWMAGAGPAVGYVEAIESATGRVPDDCGPVARCVRERQPVVVGDLLGDLEIRSWRAVTVAHGLRAVAVLPIRFPCGETAALAVYASESNAFQDKEVALLTEIADDLSFALHHLDKEQERRRVESVLRRHEELLEQTGRIAQVGGWEYDVETGRGAWTKEVARIHDVDPDAPTSAELGLRYYRGESLARITRALREATEEGKPFDLELELVTPSGVRKWVRTIGRPTVENGRVVRVGGAFQDITESRKAAAELAAEAARRRLLFEGSRDGIVIIDETGAVVEANPSFAAMLGYAVEEMRRLHVWDWDTQWTREELLGLIRRLDRSGDFFETRQRRKDGTLIDVEVSSSAVHWDGRKLVFCQCRDISHRKLLEGQLQQAQKLEAIGQLAGGVAHDFNNILAAQMMHLGLIEQSPGLPAEMRASIRELLGGAERGATLVRQLLAFGRRSLLQVRPIALNEAVENLLKMLRRLIGETIRLEWHGQPGLPWIRADAGMVEQVVMNLVVNARDAMPGGGTVTLRTALVTLDSADLPALPESRPGPYVRLSVRDNGCGMEPEVRKRVFDPFFTTKELGKGTGLGLATVYGIARQHRGWATVESEVGRGSEFAVFFPAEELPESRAVPPSPLAPSPGGGETIFFVEDDAAVRTSLSRLLQRLGYKVHTFGDGREALAAWDRLGDSIDLLFTDLVMPEGINGIDLARELRRRKPGLKTILSSGYAPDLVQAREIGQAEGVLFLPKPYDAATLSRAIRGHLNGGTGVPFENAGETSVGPGQDAAG